MRSRFTFTVSVLSSMKASDCHSSIMSSWREMMAPLFSMSRCSTRNSLRVSSTPRPSYSTRLLATSSTTPLCSMRDGGSVRAARRSTDWMRARSTAGL